MREAFTWGLVFRGGAWKICGEGDDDAAGVDFFNGDGDGAAGAGVGSDVGVSGCSDDGDDDDAARALDFLTFFFFFVLRFLVACGALGVW